MITCPGCQKTLPDWSKNCQFCGADTAKVSRPEPVKKPQYVSSLDAPKWVWWAYYGIGAYWMIGGFISVLEGFGLPKLDFSEVSNIVALVMGGVNVLIGLGILLRIEFIRGIVNVICFMNILSGLLGAWGSFLGIGLFGFVSVLFMLLNLFDVATGGLMIFLLGETDKRAPNS
jgi:hypothetical protein